MSILKPEFVPAKGVPEAALPASASAPDGAADTALIARLANELYLGSGGASAAAGQEGGDALPRVAASPAEAVGGDALGIPASLGRVPVLPAATQPEGNTVALAGGFPATTSSAGVPPVHPSVVDAQIEEGDAGVPAAASEQLPASPFFPADRGGSSEGGYAFGEPRLDSLGQGAELSGWSSSTRHVPVDAIASAEPEHPAYYFLHQALPAANLPAGAVPSLPSELSHDPFAAAGSAGRRAGFGGGHADWASVLNQPASAGFDIQAVRRDFPALHQYVNGKPLIWLDNAATTHKPQAVIDATSAFYSRDNSNIHRAAHTLAARSTDLFEAGREKVRRFLGAADAKEIVFVRGTTEAINLVAQSFGRSRIGEGDEILLTELEHHANIVPWQILASQTGARLRVIPINDRGELILEKVPGLITDRTRIVSVAHVSNSLGTVNPVQEIIALAHSRGVPVLVDGAQSTPHLPVNVQALDADFYVFSGHKIFAPTGIGALYAKKQWLDALPAWQGGGHMIRDVTFEKTVFNGAPEKFEAGTPDIAGVVGLGAAIDYLFSLGIPALAAYEHSLLEYATHALATVPGLRPIGTAANKASVLSFVIPGFDNLKIARFLDEQGIAVRAGHHCAQPAIRHFGLESSVRPSLAFYNTFSEIDALADALRRFVRR